MKNKRVRNDIRFSNLCYWFTLFLFLVFVGRCCMLSLSHEVDGVNLQEFASRRTTKHDTIIAKRGTIYDVKGEALAQNVYSYTLLAYLEEERGEGHYVKDKEITAEALSTVIELDKDSILKLLQKDTYQTEFGNAGKGLTELVKDKIVALNLDGIDFIETQKRYYPKGDFLSYTLGYAKSSEDGLIQGELGLEALYDKELTGVDGFREYQKDLRGYKIAGTNEVVQEAENGQDIYLTIDASVQFLIEQAIDNVADKYGFEQLNIVVAEAKTGKILGLSTYPSFDPNKRNMKSYLDPNISVAFEPGSTMKIFSYMAVMEAGKYNGEETFKSGTYVTKDGTELGDWDRKGWGMITYDKGFALSSNTGIVNLIDKYLSREELLAYYQKLGFGSKTGIELANETAGKLAFKYETEVFNAGFGQGIMTTSLQYIKALTAISNDGVLLQPYLVDRIIGSNGEVILQNGRKELDRVASHETIVKMKDLMESVVQIGTGTPYKMEGYDIIAKTGTAQIASENGTGYLRGESDVIRGFAGMYPKDDPDIIIYANVKKPRPNTVAPLSTLVKEIIENMSKIRSNKVGETMVATEEIEVPSLLNQSLESVEGVLKEKGISYHVIGNGDKVVSQYPLKGAVVTSGEKVFVRTNGEEIVIPNFQGWSKKDVNEYCKLVGIKAHFDGVGYVASQSVVEGTVLQENMEINLVLEKKFKEDTG